MLAVHLQASSASLVASAYSTQTTIHALSAVSSTLSRSLLTTHRPSRSSQSVQRRNFWWGRGCSSYMSPASSQYAEARRKIYKYHLRELQRAKSHWNLKDGGFEKEIEALRQYSPRTAERLRRIQEIQRRIEADPYEALFGSRSLVLGERPFLRAWTRFFFKFKEPDAAAPSKSSTPQTSSLETKPQHNVEYEIDPITLRKIPKQIQSTEGVAVSPNAKPTSPDRPLEEQESADSYENLKKGLDAKRRQYYSALKAATEAETQAHPRRTDPKDQIRSHEWNWLEQEGFQSKLQQDTASPGSEVEPNDLVSAPHQSKLEEAYNSLDMKAEDLDLLRSSDVKAGSGIIKSKPSESPTEKGEYQKKLNNEFESLRPVRAEDTSAREAIDSYRQRKLAPKEGDQAAEIPQPLATAQKEQGRKLVRDIRGIYENEYGTIDTKHRQPTAVTSGPAVDNVPSTPPPAYEAQSASSSPPARYQILAYDSSTQQVVSAESLVSSSSFSPAKEPSDRTLSVPEVLMSINNPAKFLPYFAALQKQGFELVKASGDVVVFRMGDGEATTPSSPPPAAASQSVSAPSKAETAAEPAPAAKELPTSRAEESVKVRKEEPVFSGTRGRFVNNSWRHRGRPGYGPQRLRYGRRGRFRRVARRVFWTAVWVAACTYATGVVIEFFRTGGVDGKGAVGF